MCLVTDWDKPRIAEKDITCYKWYVKIDSVYLSPYQGEPIPAFNTVVYSDLDKPEKNLLLLSSFQYKYIVEKGFHSFVNSIDAKYNRYNQCANYEIRNTIIVSCVIPKGSRYYKGVFGNADSYCSEAIIIKEIM